MRKMSRDRQDQEDWTMGTHFQPPQMKLRGNAKRRHYLIGPRFNLNSFPRWLHELKGIDFSGYYMITGSINNFGSINCLSQNKFDFNFYQMG